MTDLKDLVFQVAPSPTPFYRFDRTARRKLTKQHGQSGRARRRRMAKPLSFTAYKDFPVYEWIRDTFPGKRLPKPKKAVISGFVS
ncbi:hypothetical protein [Acidovorax sp. BL-A-41-H1]|uniref:hypothetical protein n=1 Tax=Acidovorax sp. BL-A-41-H1 TaxID=3421102 RepID=UPI003F79AA3C